MNTLFGEGEPASAPKKILILYSSSGGGHLAAAKNIKQGLNLVGRDLEIEIKDSYDFVHPFKKWQYTRGWQLATTLSPGPYRYFRNRVVHSRRAVGQLKKGFAKAAKKLSGYLADNPVDAIIATHAHAAGIASQLKDAPYRQDFYLAQVYTDYQFHAFYATKNVDRYFAPAEWVAVQLKKDNSRARVSASGAPISVCFGIAEDKTKLKKRFGLEPDDRLVVLVSRGSFGWGNRKNLEIVKRLVESGLPLHVIAHAGKNKKLAEQMFKLGHLARRGATLRVVGWVNNMYDLMRITDVYVGKPGGMQVAEALAAGVPLLMFDPMPGQEDANVDFVVAQKVGALVEHPGQIVKRIEEFSSDRALLWAYKKRAKSIGSPLGSLTTSRQILKDLGWAVVNGDPDLAGCLPGPPSTK